MNRALLVAMASADLRTAVHTFRATVPGGPRFLAKKADDKIDNEIYIYDAIGDSFFGGIGAKDVVAALKEMDDKKPLNLFINSPGGDVWEATAIYNALARFKSKKQVFIDGVAASAASYIAMIGDEITTAFNAMWMIHNPWGIVIGNYQDLRKTADDLEKMTGTLRATYAKRTGKTTDEVAKTMDEETWFDAKEALAYGLTDKVTEAETEPDEDDKEARASASVSLLAKYKNTPDKLKPSVAQMVASMETRLKNNLPKRASPQRRSIPGQPGTRS